MSSINVLNPSSLTAIRTGLLRGGGIGDSKAARTVRRCTPWRSASARIDRPSHRTSRRMSSNSCTRDSNPNPSRPAVWSSQSSRPHPSPGFTPTKTATPGVSRWGHFEPSLARALEIVGERWSLLIVQDFFYGVSRFNDLIAHLGISRAVLAERLASLTAAGVLIKATRLTAHAEYKLTKTGEELWPAIFSLIQWGQRNDSAHETREYIFTHSACGSVIDGTGYCETCREVPGPENFFVYKASDGRERHDLLTRTLEAGPHRLLAPIRA